MNNRLYNAFTRLEIKKQNKESLIPGLLGLMLGGEKVVEVPDRPGYVYVRIRNTTNELVMAFNDQVSPVYDLPVLLVRDDIDKTRYKIQGRDVGKYENWGSVSAYLPRHGNQHSFNPDSGGGGDIVWVYDRQLMPLALSPSGTSGAGDVVISPDVIFQQNGWRMVGGTGTANLLGYKPTGSNARLVLVYIDSNGNPQAAVGSYFSASITGAGAILPYMPSVPSATDIPLGAIRLVSGTSEILWDNIYDLRVIFRDSITATGSASKHIIQDDGVSQTERTYLNFVGAGFVVYDNGSATVVSGTASSAPGGGAPTYPAIFDDSVFKATGTAISFGNNLTVVATGTSVFIDSTGGGAGGFPAIYDDSVFKVTGAAISFGSNLTVAFTGTTAFIDASGGGGAGSYPAIYDDSVYKVTGSLINYGHNLDVIVTGSVAHVKVPDGITIYDGNNQVGILRSMDAGGDRWVINDLYVVTGSNATISMRLRDYTGSTNIAELSLIRDIADINQPYLSLQIATVPIFAADLHGFIVYGDHYAEGGMFVGAINAPVADYNPATGTIIFRNTAPPPAITGSYSVLFVENHIPKVRNANGSIFVPINGMLVYDDNTFKGSGTAISFGNNLSVAVTGTTVFVDAAAGGGGGYPAIYDDATFKATGSSLVFGDNLTVAVTGSFVYINGIAVTGSSSLSGSGDHWVYPWSSDWTGVTGSPLTSSSWNGNSISTAAKTEIVLATAFPGIPSGCNAILARVYCRDAASAGGVYWYSLSPNNIANNQAGVAWADRQTNDRFGEADFVCPCNPVGNVYYQAAASGVGTLDVWIEIWGYSIDLGAGGFPAIYDDSTFKATGTAISFGANLSVAVTGTTVFVDASGGGGAGGYPAIYDGSTFKATGSSISFGDYLSVASTGTSVYVDLSAFSGSNYLVYPLYVPGTLVANQVSVFTVPTDLVLLEVQACGSNTNDGLLRVGNSTNNAAYLADFSIGDGGIPVRKNLASDFVSGQFPVISAGTRMIFTLDYDGAAGTPTQYFDMTAIFAGKSVISATGTLGTTPIVLQNVATPSAPPSGYTTIFSASGTPKAIDQNGNIFEMVSPIYGYAPTWTTTGTQPAIGNGTLTGTYAFRGDYCIIHASMIAGSTTTFGTGYWEFGLPLGIAVASGSTDIYYGYGKVRDAGVGSYFRFPQVNPNDTKVSLFIPADLNIVTVERLDNSSPMAWGNGDNIHFSVEFKFRRL